MTYPLLTKITIVLGATLALTIPATAQSRAEIAERLDQAAEVVSELMNAPDSEVPGSLMEDAECVAVIPGLKKGAFGFGAEYGRGAVSCREASGGFGAPSMLALFGGSFGFQVGGSTTDVVMLFMSDDGIDYLIRNEFTLGGDASVAAGPKGRNVEAETDVAFQAEILSYSRSQGVFAGASLEGTSLQQDHEANEVLYGEGIAPTDILLEDSVPAPREASSFVAALESAD